MYLRGHLYFRLWWTELRLLGELPPDQQGISDRQFTSDPAIVSIVTCSAKWGAPNGHAAQTSSGHAKQNSIRRSSLERPLNNPQAQIASDAGRSLGSLLIGLDHCSNGKS